MFDDENEDDELEKVADSQREARLEVAETIELSLNSVVGLTTLGRMKLKGVIKEAEVTILIDCGATHNFIGLNLVDELQLPLATTTYYGVVIGTGVAIKGKGICRGVVLTMQGPTIVQDFLPLDLGSTNVVLGMQWLGSLGTMEVNWNQLTMKFRMGNSNMVLQGDLSLNKSRVSLKAMMKEIRQEGQGILVEFSNIAAVASSDPWPIPKEVQGLLDQFQPVFNMPAGLPPTRETDQAIQLSDEGTPINVRPYRYPHLQKNEIEQMVKDMLAAGIIQPSVSPFSSPVLLLKKKYGS